MGITHSPRCLQQLNCDMKISVIPTGNNITGTAKTCGLLPMFIIEENAK